MSGPIKPTEGNVTRQGDPRGGGKRRQVQSHQIVINNATGAYAQTQFSFKVNIPSSRLSCLVAVTYVPVNAEDTAFPASGATAWQLALTAWVQLDAEQGGSWTRANAIIPNTPLPYSQEVGTTLVKQWRGVVTVPNAPGAGLVPGTLWITAIWEPAPGESVISDDELRLLFGAATIEGVQGGTVSVTGT